MSDTKVQEGTVSFKVQQINATCQTYYKIIGDISSNSPRLVILHGGPGTGHEYLLPFKRLWQEFNIPVVFYDHIGCAASTHLPQTAGDESLWQESHFLAELNNLIDALQLRDGPGYHILGHSWGGRVAAAFAASQPRGLQRLVIASGRASTESYIAGLKRLISQLPDETRLAVVEAEEQGKFDSPKFKAAMDVSYRKHFCCVDPLPKELLPAWKHMSEDKTVRETVAGPSPVNSTNSYRDWTCIPRLQQVVVPTPVYNGEFDTSHDMTTMPFFEHIPRNGLKLPKKS